MIKEPFIVLGLLLSILLITLPFVQAQDASRLQVEAKELFDAKDYTGALAKFQTIVTQYPTSSMVPESLYYIGNCQYRLKDISAAVSTYNTLIQQYSSDTWSNNAYWMLGYSYGLLHQDTEAITAFQQFINNNPTSSDCPDAALRIARLTSRSNPTKTLVRLNAYKSVLDNYPNTPEAKEAQISYGRILWRISEEITQWNLTEKLDKKDETIDYFINLSQQYTGDTEIQAYAQMQVGALWLEKARLLDGDQKSKKCIEYYTQAKTELKTFLSKYTTTKPEYLATVNLMISEITLFTQELNDALPEFQKVIINFATDSACRKQVCISKYWVALILENQGKYTDVIQEYQNILDNYNTNDNYLWTNVQAISLFGQYRCYSALGNNRACAEVLLKLIDRYPDTPVSKRAKEEINKIGT